MSLARELGLRQPFATLEHEALLNIYFSSTCIRKAAGRFLEPFGISDVQLNLLMMLHHQAGSDEGLNQAQLSEMMLVNRANITSLIDRMQRDGWVTRRTDPADRRFNIIRLTPRARQLLERVEPLYAREVGRIMGALSPSEQRTLVEMLEKVRARMAQ